MDQVDQYIHYAVGHVALKKQPKGVKTMNYSTYTNEELVSIIQSGDEAAYDQLFRNLAPITLHEAEMYRGKMDTYGTEDFLQEGTLLHGKSSAEGTSRAGNSAPTSERPSATA